ncbi:hypothetical protein [Microvirga arabica]|uniref:hypothetical protein n=1 Tax=Microvirga arabica TaxID=1128671 RepID=UPI00193A1685|nr:hypothetical protein [Microvirga arabica]MBM1170357.1 hypothetical protein [Microvirga arabica]
MAVGLNKPVFLIVSEPRDLPSTLKGLPYIRAPYLEDDDALASALLPLTENLNKLKPRAIARRQAKGVDPHGSRLIKSGHSGIAQAEPPSGGMQVKLVERETLERLSQAFVSSGATVTLEPKSKDKNDTFRPDLLVWDSRLPSDFGNLLVVEIKHGSDDKLDIAAKRQLSEYLSASHLRTGILAVNREPARQLEYTGSGYVFVLSVEALLDAVSGKRLPELLRSIRNRAAHGPF